MGTACGCKAELPACCPYTCSCPCSKHLACSVPSATEPCRAGQGFTQEESRLTDTAACIVQSINVTVIDQPAPQPAPGPKPAHGGSSIAGGAIAGIVAGVAVAVCEHPSSEICARAAKHMLLIVAC